MQTMHKIVDVCNKMNGCSVRIGQARHNTCTNIPGYECIPNYDHQGGDLSSHSIGSNLHELAYACNKTVGCKAFNTNGYIKNNIDNFHITPNLNTYIKETENIGCIEIPGYSCLADYDHHGNDIAGYGRGTSVYHLAQLCSETTGCTGFNTDGFLKDNVTNVYNGRGANIYIKN
jgi:hypothetical protein